MRDIVYFGCGHDTGHYLFDAHRNRISSTHLRFGKLEKFDGLLAPLGRKPYIAAVSRLSNFDMSALSWWDHSVDKRPGSNSIVFVPGLTLNPSLMVAVTSRFMPWVITRLPQPLELLENVSGGATPDVL